MRKLTMDELGRLSVEAFKQAEKKPVIVVLDNIRSFSNVGAVFRSADAFLVEAIYLCGITPKPPHREIHKTALGATDTVAWRYFEKTSEAMLQLKKNNYHIAAIEQTNQSVSLEDFKPNFPLALIFGNEVDGIDDEILTMCDVAVEIPQSGTKHSLNIAVCAGIAIWHTVNQK
ncbi:MAG: RNA methyltransferase [Bacteroidales bacterium]|nr:RNA methyltransferase [Bacteroidales bacterium]